jgi:hypothetical protein
MAPALIERYFCNSYDYYGDCYYSSWDSWGRWVLLAGVILFILFIALVFS